MSGYITIAHDLQHEKEHAAERGGAARNLPKEIKCHMCVYIEREMYIYM